MTYILLLIGFLLLIKGADFFVEGSSNVARLLKVPSVIIGLTVVAFGTSMPEASVSITAALSGSNELALSNVIGSNIFNLMMVTGVCSMIQPLPVSPSVLKKEFPFSIVITLALFVMGLDQTIFHSSENMISQINGLTLLLLFVLFLVSTIRTALRERQDMEKDSDIPTLSPLTSFLYIVGGLTGIVIGGNLVVDSARNIALSFGLTETFIGLTIVSIGTSLPELVTSIVAAKKGENDIALGNVVGSNIFNILLILGASSALHPVGVNAESVIDILVLILSSALVYGFAIQKKKINRFEGFCMVAIYAVYAVYITMR